MYFNNNDDERNKLNPANWSHLSTRDHLDGMLSGKLPVQRNQYDVNKGKSPYYYLDEDGNEYDRPVGAAGGFSAGNTGQPQNTNYGTGTVQNGIENRFNNTASNRQMGRMNLLNPQRILNSDNVYNQPNDSNIINRNQTYIANIQNWVKAKNRIAPLRISDENKHQYMGCLLGNGDVKTAYIGMSLGALKEAKDFIIKSTNAKMRDQYGGIEGVVQDGVKDMRNNIKGLYYKWQNPDEECWNLLKNKI